jgi:hypothetical protein
LQRDRTAADTANATNLSGEPCVGRGGAGAVFLNIPADV